MATKHQKFSLNLSGYDEVEREAIALEVIDKIIKRTKQGLDKNGKEFSGKAGQYTKGYKNSKNYEIAGKSSKVNLTLSGDMLDAIEILKNSTKVVIGYEKGSSENAKADGNIRGTYGQPSPNPSKARDFLGISEKELNQILKKYPKGTDKSRERAQELLLVNKESQRLSGAIELDDLED